MRNAVTFCIIIVGTGHVYKMDGGNKKRISNFSVYDCWNDITSKRLRMIWSNTVKFEARRNVLMNPQKSFEPEVQEQTAFQETAFRNGLMEKIIK